MFEIPPRHFCPPVNAPRTLLRFAIALAFVTFDFCCVDGLAGALDLVVSEELGKMFLLTGEKVFENSKDG